MLKLIITKFWPVLVVITIYIICYIFILKQQKNRSKAKKIANFYYLIIAIIIAAIISIFLFFWSNTQSNTRYYIPAESKNGEIIPAKIK